MAGLLTACAACSQTEPVGGPLVRDVVPAPPAFQKPDTTIPVLVRDERPLAEWLAVMAQLCQDEECAP